MLREEQERELIGEVLGRHGAPPGHASVQAGWLTEADMRGHSSHGIQRLPMLVRRIEHERLDPSAVAELRWASESACAVDGNDGFGPVVGVEVVARLADRAAESGVAVAAVRRSNHLGLLAPYVEGAAARGLIGIASTTSEALVHPWGGVPPMIGTNPLAIGVPADPSPFVLDMATGTVSMGKVLDHARRGEPLEPGWAIDADGNPTSQAEAAVDGAISPFGGAKGYALGLGIELLVAALSGTALGPDVHGTLDAEHPSSKGDLFICLDPARFGAVDSLADVSSFLERLRAAQPSPGSAGVQIPGDRARAERSRRRREGIEIPPRIWETIEALGVEMPAGAR